jgi:hypothetical protein
MGSRVSGDEQRPCLQGRAVAMNGYSPREPSNTAAEWIVTAEPQRHDRAPLDLSNPPRPAPLFKRPIARSPFDAHSCPQAPCPDD